MKIALIPGTFDPITIGHMDLIERASILFDQLIIGVANGGNKQPLIALSTRVAWLRQLLNSEKIGVVTIEGLLIDCVRMYNANVIVRGVRNGIDLAYESQLTGMNRYLAPEIETIFLLPRDPYRSITSSLVREIYLLGSDIDQS